MTIITTGAMHKTPTVFTDIFKVKIKEGLPLDLLAKKITDSGYLIDWNAEIEGALKLGIAEDSILKNLSQAFTYLYPGMQNLEIEKAKWYLRLRPKHEQEDGTIKTLYK